MSHSISLCDFWRHGSVNRGGFLWFGALFHNTPYLLDSLHSQQFSIIFFQKKKKQKVEKRTEFGMDNNWVLGFSRFRGLRQFEGHGWHWSMNTWVLILLLSFASFFTFDRSDCYMILANSSPCYFRSPSLGNETKLFTNNLLLHKSSFSFFALFVYNSLKFYFRTCSCPLLSLTYNLYFGNLLMNGVP